MKNMVIVSTVSPNAEPRGAVLRLQNLITAYYDKVELIIVLGFKSKLEEHFRGKRVIYLTPSKFDWINISFKLVFKPITNAIYFRSHLRAYVSRDHKVLFHLIRPYQRLNSLETTVDMCESLAANFSQRASFYSWFRVKKYIMLYESMRLKKLEDKLIKNNNIRKILISKSDRLFSDTPDMVILPNKFSLLQASKITNYQDKKFVFIGHVDYEPNLLCVINCADMLKKINPNFRISVVGRCSRNAAAIIGKHKNIDIHGFVDDPSLILSDGYAGLAIMAIGTGQQNKVLDYISCGVPPIVSSNVRAAYPGETPFLVADNFNEFQQSIRFLSIQDNRVNYMLKCISYMNALA